MVIGLAIIVFVLVVALILLFVYKRNSYPEIIDVPKNSKGKYKKVLVVILILGSSIYAYQNFIDRPVVPKDFVGIHFRMTKDEVLYVMGKPEKTIKYDDKSITPQGLNDISAYDKKENHWHYKHSTHGINIYFDEESEKVYQVSCNLTEDTKYVSVIFCETNKVGLGYKEEIINNILGVPDEIKFLDGLKFVSYKKFNTTFALNKKGVTQIVVSSPDRKLN